MTDRKPDAGTPATDERCEWCGSVACECGRAGATDELRVSACRPCSGCGKALPNDVSSCYCWSSCVCLGARWCIACYNLHIDRKEALADRPGATDESAAEDRSAPPPTYAVKETERGDCRSTADGLGLHDDSYQANSYVERCAIARAAAVAACWAHYDAHPAVAELARAVPCQSCGADPRVSPPSGKELPIVKGALDAQVQAERRAHESAELYRTTSRVLALVQDERDEARAELAREKENNRRLLALANASADTTDDAQAEAGALRTELARVRELGLDGVDREENLKHHLRRAQAERDEARRRADALSQVVQPAWMLLDRLVEYDDVNGLSYGLIDLAAEARPILAKLQSLPQHTVASTDQPQTLSEVTTSTMPRSAPAASEGDGPLGDGGIEE